MLHLDFGYEIFGFIEMETGPTVKPWRLNTSLLRLLKVEWTLGNWKVLGWIGTGGTCISGTEGIVTTQAHDAHNFSSGIFDLTLFETSNQFEPLSADNAKSSELEFSFNLRQATSSRKRSKAQSLIRDQRDGLSLHSTVNNTDKQLLHPSLLNDTEGPQSIHISKEQRKDMPFKVININCQSVANKKASLLTLCESTGADVVIGTESWLTDQHLSTEIFPDNYKVYRHDRKKKKGGGVFVLVKSTILSLEPEELSTNNDCEMIWV